LHGAVSAHIISQMILRQLFQVSREELQKAKRAILAAYEIMREADERALASLLMFLGLR
jgi:hypothetical protein